MKNHLRFLYVELFLMFFIIHIGFSQVNEWKNKTKLRRADSFFGVHFDFHAGMDCNEIGNNINEDSILALLNIIKPDFIQIDCKGHPGLSSYPTKVGNRAPGFIGDPLKIWREATNKKNVALYMHYSGVYDEQAIKNDSSFARVNADGRRDKSMTSVFSSYVDKIMILQFKELSQDYNVDGIWVDGDCWATGNDYGEESTKEFLKESGFEFMPKTKDDKGYFELCEFSRKSFKKYLKHYVDEMHKFNPNFQVASNWSFSSFMPEEVDVNVDFLSGDYNYVSSYNSARWEGRCLQNQGKPWDLMTWGFIPKDGSQRYKSTIQLIQEAAAVISLGGGFQAYFTQNRDGSILSWKIKPMSEVGKFIRLRQKYLQGVTPIPQIALFYSKDDFYRRIGRLYGGWDTGDYIKGLLYALLDGQNVVQILSEHHLRNNYNKYPLIILPEMYYLDDNIKKDILNYVNNGGSLLVTGYNSSKFFFNEMNIIEDSSSLSANSYYLNFNEEFSTVNGNYHKIKLPENSIVKGYLYSTLSPRSPQLPAGAIFNYGKGKIGFIFIDIGSHYFKGASSKLRDYISCFIKDLFPNPVVQVKGSHYLDVTLNSKNGKTIINLINTSGNHNSSSIDVYDEVLPINDTYLTISYPKKPKKVFLLPDEKNINFIYKDSKILIKIPKIEIHSLVVIE